MAITVDEHLLDAWRAGRQHVRLDAADATAAVAGLTAARAALFTIAHPEEPDDPLPSFASEISVSGASAEFWFDAPDTEAYDGLLEALLAAIVDAIEAAGIVTAVLSAIRLDDPMVGGSSWLDWLDRVPMPDGAHERADWRSSHPSGARLGFSSDRPVADLIAFFERELPRAGLAITGSWILPKALVAGISYESGPRAGSVEMVAMPTSTDITLRAYAARSRDDRPWQERAAGGGAPRTAAWQIRPTFTD